MNHDIRIPAFSHQAREALSQYIASRMAVLPLISLKKMSIEENTGDPLHGRDDRGLFFLHVAAESSHGSWIYTYALAKQLADEVSAGYLTSAFWEPLLRASGDDLPGLEVNAKIKLGSSMVGALPWLIGQFFEAVGPQVFPAFLTGAIVGSIVLLVVILILLRRRRVLHSPS